MLHLGHRIITLFLLLILIVSCSSPKKSISSNPDQQELVTGMEDMHWDADSQWMEKELPLMEVYLDSDSLPYRPSHTRRWDLLHTALEIRFDVPAQRVPGTAQLLLTPLAYPDSILILDAKNFDIHKITFTKGGAGAIRYEYDSVQIKLLLGKTFRKKDTIGIEIQYTAKPAERKVALTESAVSSDQGLFFINPKNDTRNKPFQIWTQGETSYNSCWFPTIDHPNERCTGEIRIEVEDKYRTLSNGVLKSSVRNADGMRTDHWVMDIPHAPYLFMMAIGDFAVVKEEWKGLDLAYYVEKKFAPQAKDIFAHTPEMLSFFSEIYGLNYPWQKYHQVVVRDYVSGAMENTTAVIFGDFVQKTKRQLLEEHNDKIVAHEMAHHWFGNYVTCESWSNLTMNEGFANYAEYQWMEHKYGRSDADWHRMQELNAYLEQSREGGAKHLIRFSYENEQDMFDVHSYNKGGLVLHMLRSYLGDEVYKEGIRLFLHQNALKPVEAHHLRLAMEEVSGEDLNWFFNQWYFDKGHPELEVFYSYVPEVGSFAIKIAQVQNERSSRKLFELPIELDIYQRDGKTTRHYIRMTDREAYLEIPIDKEPLGILLDPEYTLLAEINYLNELSEVYHIRKFEEAPSVVYKLESFQLIENADESFYGGALTHPYWQIRNAAAESTVANFHKESLWTLVKSDPNAAVRAQAIGSILSQMAFDESNKEDLIQILGKGENESGEVAALALLCLTQIDKEAGNEYLLRNFESEEDPNLLLGMIGLMINEEINRPLTDVTDKVRFFSGYDVFTFLSYVFMLSEQKEDEELRLAIEQMSDYMAFDDSKPIQRYGMMTLLANLKADREGRITEGGLESLEENMKELEWVVRQIELIRSRETNPQLKAFYEYIR